MRNEFNQGPGFAWVTRGREIENYVAPDILSSAVKKVHPRVYRLVDSSPYAHAYESQDISGKPVPVDKIKVARAVVAMDGDLHVLDLQQQVVRVVRFIKAANGLT